MDMTSSALPDAGEEILLAAKWRSAVSWIAALVFW